MVSSLVRTTLQTACRRAIVVSPSRQIHISSTQYSWFGRLLRGSKSVEALEEAPKTNAVEQTKSPELHPSVDAVQNSRKVIHEETIQIVQVTEPAVLEPVTEEVLPPKPKIKRSPLSPNAKQRRFDENISFMEPRLGRHPERRSPLIRKTLWIRTLALCQTEEQVKKVMELIPRWRDLGHHFDETFSLAFIRRCIYLNKPELALELFGNFGKYNVPLTQSGARELLAATYDTRPLSFVVTLTSLFDVYQLPNISKDFPSCSMLVAACFNKEASENVDARNLGFSLLRHLRGCMDKTAELPPPKGDEVVQKLPDVWTIHAMKKVEERLPAGRGGEQAKHWVHNWRKNNGHITVAV